MRSKTSDEPADLTGEGRQLRMDCAAEVVQRFVDSTSEAGNLCDEDPEMRHCRRVVPEATNSAVQLAR